MDVLEMAELPEPEPPKKTLAIKRNKN